MIIAIKEKDKVVIGYSNTENWGKLANEDYIDEENVAVKFAKCHWNKTEILITKEEFEEIYGEQL